MYKPIQRPVVEQNAGKPDTKEDVCPELIFLAAVEGWAKTLPWDKEYPPTMVLQATQAESMGRWHQLAFSTKIPGGLRGFVDFRDNKIYKYNTVVLQYLQYSKYIYCTQLYTDTAKIWKICFTNKRLKFLIKTKQIRFSMKTVVQSCIVLYALTVLYF